MRIAYVVDVHDRFEAVVRAASEFGAVDLLIVGGDITTGGTPDDAQRAIECWYPLAPRVLALAGNMDSAAIDDRLAELAVALDGRGVVFGEVGVFGVSAAPRSPLHTPYELDDEELERRIEAGFASVEHCRTRVFCPHAPPRDTACDRLRSGEHVGSTVVRAFVEREQPALVLCGHIHESRGKRRDRKSTDHEPRAGLGRPLRPSRGERHRQRPARRLAASGLRARPKFVAGVVTDRTVEPIEGAAARALARRLRPAHPRRGRTRRDGVIGVDRFGRRDEARVEPPPG